MKTPEIELLNVACPCCGRVDRTRKDFDFPDSMGCCDDCGCDFIIVAGEIEQITFNPFQNDNNT